MTRLVSIIGWLAGFAAGYMTTMVAGVIILPTLGAVRTLMLVGSGLAGIAFKAWRARPVPQIERRVRRMAPLWRWRGDGLADDRRP